MGCLQAKNKNIVVDPSHTNEKQPSALPAIAGGNDFEGASLVNDDGLSRGNNPSGAAGRGGISAS